MLLIDSLYINNSGGLELLKYLVEYIETKQIECYYIFDERCEEHFKHISSSRKSVLKASSITRLYFYFKNKKRFDRVFCFANLPAPITTKGKVFTYFHNINLINTPKKSSKKTHILNFIKRSFIKIFKNNTNKWIVQTNNTKNTICKTLNIHVDDVYVFPFYKPTEDITIKNNCSDYVYVSNYTYEKNHELLIRAWNKLYDLGYKLTLHLTLSSIPNQLNILLLESIEKGIQIINHGFIPKNQIGELYQKSKATVYPSFNESLGLGIIEALEYGCDVIGSNRPYIHTICEPSATFNPEDVDSLVEAIIKYETKQLPTSKLLVKNEIETIFNIILK